VSGALGVARFIGRFATAASCRADIAFFRLAPMSSVVP